MRIITIAVAITIALSGCKTGGGSTEQTATPAQQPTTSEPVPPSFEPWLTARINGPGDAEYWRSELQRGIFGVAGIPLTMPVMVEAIFDPVFSGHNIDRLTLDTDGTMSTAYVIHPHSPNGDLAIWHQGHDGDFRVVGNDYIKTLLDEGYRVLALSMPSQSHEGLPLKQFIGPVVTSLNWADANYAPIRIIMVGLSGGGWTTVVTAAMDERIDISIPVAGSWPCHLRETVDPASNGDYEQRQFCERPDLPTYLELYILGSFQRSQLQIFNYSDSCCFAGDHSLRYEGFIQDRSGDFQVLIDRSHEGHIVSDWAWGQIKGYLASEPSL